MKKTTHTKVPMVRIEMKPSLMLKGQVGVFAVRALKKDSIIVDASQFLTETLVPWSDFKALDKITQSKIMDYCSGDEQGFYTPPDLNYLSIGWHLNHSCSPNVGFNKGYNFVAMRNIKKGEELFWDYSYDESNPDFSMKCSCGGKHCRKVITGNDWKLLAKNKRIWNYLSSDIQKLATKAGVV